jgi:hypothetical protein
MSDQLAARLTELRARLRAVAAELAAAPAARGADLADEARWLVRTIARFEREDAAGA